MSGCEPRVGEGGLVGGGGRGQGGCKPRIEVIVKMQNAKKKARGGGEGVQLSGVGCQG